MTALTRIVCTRILKVPEKQDAIAHGIAISDHDFLSFEYAENEELIDILKYSTAPFVFTSQHGVRAVKHIMDKYNLRPVNERCFCIEGETKQQAEQAGFHVTGEGGNSLELASVIISQGIPEVVFFCGNLRRDELKNRLKENNIAIRDVEVYHKTLIPLKVEEPFQGIMFYSPSQIDAFTFNNHLPDDIPAFCIGSTTGAHLQALGHRNIIVADQKNTTALLNKIYQYYK